MSFLAWISDAVPVIWTAAAIALSIHTFRVTRQAIRDEYDKAGRP